MGVWDQTKAQLAATRVEVVTEPSAVLDLPWEMLRDPATDQVLALRAGAFVRAPPPRAAARASLPEPTSTPLRMLLVISRPAGRQDVPFRSVASHLVRLSRDAREVFRLDVLRPPTFAQLSRVLREAKEAGGAVSDCPFRWPRCLRRRGDGGRGHAGREPQTECVFSGVAAAAWLAWVPDLRGSRYSGWAAAGGWPGAGLDAGRCRGAGAGRERVP